MQDRQKLINEIIERLIAEYTPGEIEAMYQDMIDGLKPSEICPELFEYALRRRNAH